ncbi:MAG: geranylgeranylglyceryl/heptaprenylglyceryl phosphate synthase [Candidatus Aenigmatarchaeota archaeon]|nr:MAG: geranylgeranylglyceryl/heptaprenylglyceryl phosphate synthase [Candidatus Aenigmarchaeota archaeon]
MKGKVFDRIVKEREKGPLHFTLIDPDKQDAGKAKELAQKAKEAGSDAIMVGGTWGDAYGEKLNGTVSRIKETGLPVIMFPNSAQQLSPDADALFFMSLLNSRSTHYLIDEQMKGALTVHQYGIEPLPMAYLIVESGSTTSAGWAGDVRPIPREKPEFAVGYALAAKYFGMKFIYLEAGSGAKQSVPPEMVAMVKKAVGDDVMVIVGGGIREPGDASEKVKAGADIIVTGTIAEKDPKKLADIIRAIKG